MNIRRAERLLQNLFDQGVREFCVCAGSRNSPLVAVLEQIQNIHRYTFFEERSAAFFALGRIKCTGRPVAVVTTSGTAAAELLPATIEAHYSSLPLVLVTADRPPHYRGTASPQTIEQVGLYSHYVANTFDLVDENAPGVRLHAARPVHVNICFDEPLLDAPIESRALAQNACAPEADAERAPSLEEFLGARQPLILIGRLSSRWQSQVEEWLADWPGPIFAEAPSGLRESPRLQDRLLRSGDGILRLPQARAADLVIRIGSVPTVRFWRDLETLLIPVVNFCDEPFAGLSRGIVSSLSACAPFLQKLADGVAGSSELLALDRYQLPRLENLLASEPLSEPAWFRWFSRAIPTRSHVYVGNSLPIREWDLAATGVARDFRVEVNRGANGIDGQLSTFWGASERSCENWGIFGDLTTLYDLSAPWIVAQLPELRWRLVVINNFGGQIFSRLFAGKHFRNEHQLQFHHWAGLWQLPYECWRETPAQLPTGSGCVIEVQPDSESSERFWRGYTDLWKNL